MRLKIYTSFVLLLVGTSLYSAEIIVNNVSLVSGTNCTTILDVQFDLRYENLKDDNFNNGRDLRGNDLYDIVIRDGDCNLIFFTTDWVEVGTPSKVFNIPGFLNSPEVMAPTSGPFTVSFHDTDNFTSQTSYLDTPPLATFILDPTPAGGACAALPDVGTPNCSFAAFPIPTLSQWGLVILTLLLVIMGISFQRKRWAQFSS